MWDVFTTGKINFPVLFGDGSERPVTTGMLGTTFGTFHGALAFPCCHFLLFTGPRTI